MVNESLTFTSYYSMYYSSSILGWNSVEPVADPDLKIGYIVHRGVYVYE